MPRRTRYSLTRLGVQAIEAWGWCYLWVSDQPETFVGHLRAIFLEQVQR